MKTLILSADRFEDSELLVPLARLCEASMQVDIGSFKAGTIHGKHGESAHANLAIATIRPDDYDALVLPAGKPVAAICRRSDRGEGRATGRSRLRLHGPQC
jgi:protease I